MIVSITTEESNMYSITHTIKYIIVMLSHLGLRVALLRAEGKTSVNCFLSLDG